MADPFVEVLSKLDSISGAYDKKLVDQITKSIRLLSARMAKVLQDQQDWNYQDVNQAIGMLQNEMEKAGLLDVAALFKQSAIQSWQEVANLDAVTFTAQESTAYAAATQAKMIGWESQIPEDLVAALKDALINQTISPISGADLAQFMMDKFEASKKNAAVWARDSLVDQQRELFQLAGQNAGAEYWEFIGPEDDRTREECLADLEQRYFTTEEMEASDLNTRYNCRHKFIPLTVKPVD